MKYLKISILIFLWGAVGGALAQQPCTPQTTFALSGGTAGNGFQYYISDAIEYSPGEFAVIGTRVGPGEANLFFARIDESGDFITTPRFLAPAAFDPIFNDGEKPAYIEEITNATGATTGFIIACTLENSQQNRIWISRIGMNGCPEWGRNINPIFVGQEFTVKGLVRTGQNDYAAISHEINGGLNGLSVHTFTSVGPPCNSYSFTDEQIPVAIAPVNLTNLPAANWVVLGRFPGQATYQLTFLDATFQAVGSMPNFDPDANNQFVTYPTDVIQLGQDLYISGRYIQGPGYGWLQKISSNANGWFNVWSKYIDFPDDPAIMGQFDHPRELAVRSGEVTLAGWTELGIPSTQFKPWMLQFDENGNYIWGKRYDTASRPYGRLHTLKTASSGGYFTAGTNYINANQSGGIQNYFAHCDELGQVGDCLCHDDEMFSIPNPFGKLAFNAPLQGFQTDCFFPTEDADCGNETDQQDVCYKPPILNCDVIIDVIGFDSCTGTVHFDAIPIGLTGSITYVWDFGDSNGGFGQSVSHSYSGPGPYTVCVTASDASCTALACVNNINPLFDNAPPVALCAPGALVPLNAFGTGNIPVNLIDQGSVDDCGPVTLSINPNMVSCADLITPVNVTLTVTDLSGNTSTCTSQVTVVDPLDPILNCPNDVTVNTDQGVCYASLDMTSTATDNCPLVNVMHTLSGAMFGTNPVNNYPPGTTTILALATDASGNTSICQYTVTVEDNEDPEAICPPNQSATIPVCEGEVVVNFPPAQFDDNCGIFETTCTNLSGDSFPCGNTTVSCTATDIHGNTSTCSFVVSVDCPCGHLVSTNIQCTSDPAVFNFEVLLEDVSGAVTCSPLLTNNTSAVNLNVSTLIHIPPNQYEFSGTITSTTNPPPTSINLLGEFNCVCADGTIINCPIPIQLTTPCCDSVFVEDREVCINQDTAQIQLLECGNVANVTQVRWYVAPAPCPPGSWGPPYQVSPGCEPLVLLPNHMDGDVCVYAEVSIGGNGPCTMLTSNMATVHLCQPISCSLPSFDRCYTGTPVPMPALNVTITNPDNCDYSLEWLDPSGNVLQTGGLSYTPSMSFDFTDPAANCYQDHNYYRVRIEGPCGPQECVSTLRLYHDSAPKGTISMTHPASKPICPSYFAELLFEPDCSEYVGDPPKWEWCHGPDQSSFVPLPGAGDKNPIWWTNRLYQDTWYQVKTQNGPCPVDTVNFLVDVRDPFEILSFNANFAPLCDPTSVVMDLDFTPSNEPGCNVTVTWYRDGTLIGTTTNAVSPVSFTYSGPDLEGNYYAIVERDCCEERLKSTVIEIPAVWQPKILGPCFMCCDTTVELQGVILNENPSLSCVFTWDTLGSSASIGTGPIYATNDPGVYYLEIDCGGCIKRDTFTLIECEYADCDDPICPINTLHGHDMEGQSLLIQPNPTSGFALLSWDEQITEEAQLVVFNSNGRIVLNKRVPRGVNQLDLDLTLLAEGIYYIHIQAKNTHFKHIKVIKSE